MARTPSLLTSGILLVGMPLVVTVIMLSSLIFMLTATELDRDRQEHARQILVQSETLQRLIVFAGQLMAQYYLSPNVVTERRLDEVLEKIPKEVGTLSTLVSGTPGQERRAGDVAVLSERFCALIDEARMSVHDSGTVDVMITGGDLRAQFMSCLKQMDPLLQAIIDDETKVVQESATLVRDLAPSLKLFSIAGLVVTVVVALLATTFYYKNVLARLLLVVDNTRRLSARQPLNPLLSGTDEIAHLDKTFHEVVDGLRQVEQLKLDFQRMISHDLRAPLASILVSLNMIEEGVYGRLNERGQIVLANSELQVARLVGLINQLLDVEKMDSGQLELERQMTPIAKILTEAQGAVSGLASGKQITISLPSADHPVFADHGRMVQVLVNLLSNALKFAPEGSTVSLLFDAEAEAARQFLRVGVHDQGRGVPEALKESIFERFKQVSKTDATEKGGTGLGLYICKMIIELHGGKIWVESVEGKGSTFWLSLPMQENVN